MLSADYYEYACETKNEIDMCLCPAKLCLVSESFVHVHACTCVSVHAWLGVEVCKLKGVKDFSGGHKKLGAN